MSEINEKTLVYEVESDTLRHSKLTKLSYHTDFSYFKGRAGIIRVINMILSAFSTTLITRGYHSEEISEDEVELRKTTKNATFTGYEESGYTIVSILLGGGATLISALFVILLVCFMEVRCELAWERINQKAHVLACLFTVGAAFTNILSIQEIQEKNCHSTRCEEEYHSTKVLKYEEIYYPPHFIYHYIGFVGFLSNAMLYSIASRIWLRNDD